MNIQCWYTKWVFPLPAADDGLAGQSQVEESLAQLEGQRVLQRLPVDDQRQLVLLPQRISQRRTVVRQRGTSGLRQTQGGKSFTGKKDGSDMSPLSVPRQDDLLSTCFYCLHLLHLLNSHTLGCTAGWNTIGLQRKPNLWTWQPRSCRS